MRILKKKHWPAMVDTTQDSHLNNNDTLLNVITWCKENVGKGRYYVVDHYSHRTFYFRAEEDATLFTLRWV
jgi:hypothetical protein